MRAEVELSQLVCYTSTQAHSSAEKDALIAGVQLRSLEPDASSMSLRGATLSGAGGSTTHEN